MGQFAIEHIQNEWKVSVRKALDREERDNYLLNITATDGTFVAKAVVEVKVLDANDNSPVCEKVCCITYSYGLLNSGGIKSDDNELKYADSCHITLIYLI